MKVFFNRISEIESHLSREGIPTFVPMSNVIVVDNEGKRSIRRKPLLSSLMFFKSNETAAAGLGRTLAGKASIYCKPGNGRIPAPIPDHEMNLFRLVTDNLESPLEYLGDDTSKYEVGQKVRVTQGPLAGAEGHICRIRGDRRLVVSISGVCAVATSYIPACFLEKI